MRCNRRILVPADNRSGLLQPFRWRPHYVQRAFGLFQPDGRHVNGSHLKAHHRQEHRISAFTASRDKCPGTRFRNRVRPRKKETAGTDAISVSAFGIPGIPEFFRRVFRQTLSPETLRVRLKLQGDIPQAHTMSISTRGSIQPFFANARKDGFSPGIQPNFH